MGPHLFVEAGRASPRDWSSSWAAGLTQAALSLLSCVPSPRPGAPARTVRVHERLWSEKSAGRRGCESFRESPRRRASQRCNCTLWGSVPLPVCL